MPASAVAAAGSIGAGIIGSNAATKAGKNAMNAANQANQNATNVYNTNQANLNPYISTGTNATNNLAGLLGIGGNAAGSQDAFNNYLNSSNYNFTKDQGQKSVASQNAATYGSGATGKALVGYGQNLAQNTLGGYESMLSGLGNQGASAASNLGSLGNQYAGQYSTNLTQGASQQNQANLIAAQQQQGILGGLTQYAGSAGGQKTLNGLGQGIQDTFDSAASGLYKTFDPQGYQQTMQNGWNNAFGTSFGQPAGSSYQNQGDGDI